MEDVDVERKDKRIIKWCEDATSLSWKKWSYKELIRKILKNTDFKSVEELISTLKG